MRAPSVIGSLALLSLAACTGNPDGSWHSDSSFASEHVCTSVDAAPGVPRAYFAPFDEVELETLCALDSAQHEVVVAHYNIRRESYIDKLVQLSARGVRVQVVVDETNAAEDYNVGDDRMEEAGIDIRRVKPSGSTSLMHFKLTVIDEALALTGSFNWNGTAALGNDENMIALRDPAIVAAYRDQFFEIRQGARADDDGRIDDASELHFSPESSLDEVLVDHIGRAEHSIDIAMFQLTRSNVGAALLAALDAGVRVRLVIERKRHGDSNIDEQLEAAGATVIRGANTIGAFSAMHQKYAVIDGRRVITGATNWTTNGTRRSDEDLLILENVALAERYQRNFADLLHVYAGVVDDEIPQPAEAGVLLHTIHDGTAWGDRVVVTGNHPALGDWDPRRGVEALTSETMFPSWTANLALPAGTRLEYKFVTVTAAGQIRWEEGPNRVVTIPEHGRAVVVSGVYGDTTSAWTPADP